jgi:hypothetical protein
VEHRQLRNGERTVRDDEATRFEALQHIFQAFAMQPVEVAAALSSTIAAMEEHGNALTAVLEGQPKSVVTLASTQINIKLSAAQAALKTTDLHLGRDCL